MRASRPLTPHDLLFRVAVVLAVAVGLSACGSGPIAPPAGPFLSCPANTQIESPDGTPVPVTYTAPTASGGTPPYSVSCNPPSGTSFSVGTNAVTCTAVDNQRRSAICSFNVTVIRPPRLTLSRFLAFGDSLTEGAVNETNYRRLVDEPNSYPTKLETALRAYFRGQSLIVMNDGVGGEMITAPSVHSPGGVVRLPIELDANRPEVLLLMEGSNDLISDPATPDDLQSAAIEGLRDMIDAAQRRGIRVFLATIPPMNPAGTKAIKPEVVAAVPIYNSRVRTVAGSKGATLVDVFDALKDHQELLSPDGLHLTILGYERVAQLFFDAIKGSLEAPGAVR